MNKTATFVPAVTETKTVEVSPVKVVLELTVSDAQVLRALLGQTKGFSLMSLYEGLNATHEIHGIPKLTLAEGRVIDLETKPYSD